MDVYDLNKTNIGMEALDRAMSSNPVRRIPGLIVAWQQLLARQVELQYRVANRCAPWFRVPQ